jgi:hypothetical protein
MAELNFGLLTPPGSQNIGNAFVQGMDQAAVARARENQNALSQYQLSAAKRTDQVQNAINNAYQNAINPDGSVNYSKVNAALAAGGAGAKIPEAEAARRKADLDAVELSIRKGTLGLQPTTLANAQVKLAEGKLKQSRSMLEGINPADSGAAQQYITWHEANHADPVLGPLLAARGVTVEQSRARINAALQQPGGLERLINESKLGVEKFAEMTKPRQPNLATDLLIPGRDGTLVPNQPLIGVQTGLRRAGAPNVTVKTEQAYSGAVATGAAKQDLAQIDRAQNLPQDFAKIDETLNILRNTDINTGLGADLFTVLDKARAQVTADKKANKRAVNTEYLDSLLGSAVFPQIQALGIGARGMDTPAERDFLRKVMTGSIGLTKDTLIQMTELRRKGLENESALFNKRVEKGEFKPFEKAAQRKVEAVTVPPLPTGAISVTAPNGKTYPFDTPAQAAAFKKAAGIP